MTKDTLYILIATMMNMNASANQNEIVNTYTAEDAKRLVVYLRNASNKKTD